MIPGSSKVVSVGESARDCIPFTRKEIDTKTESKNAG